MIMSARKAMYPSGLGRQGKSPTAASRSCWASSRRQRSSIGRSNTRQLAAGYDTPHGKERTLSGVSRVNAPGLTYLKTIGVMNNNPTGRGFGHPVDLAIGQRGRIYVLNRHAGLARVGICTLGEEYLGEFGSYGHEDGQFWLPTAIAVDSRENVYVADEYHHSVTVFDSSGAFKNKWGEHGSGDGQLDGPSGLAIDADDNVYVVDQKNCRVHKFTADGRHLLQWGEIGCR